MCECVSVSFSNANIKFETNRARGITTAIAREVTNNLIIQSSIHATCYYTEVTIEMYTVYDKTMICSEMEIDAFLQRYKILSEFFLF